MKKVLLALTGAAVAASALASGPTLIYRAAPYDPTIPDDTAMTGRNDGTGSNFVAGGYDAAAARSHERADEIVLAAGPRNVTEINVTYVCDVPTPLGTENVRVRMYDLNGAAIAPRPYSPSTMLYDSGTMLVKLGEFANQYAIPGGVDLSTLTVPNTVVWSTQSAGGVTQTLPGNFVGPRFYGPSGVGSSDNFMWRRNGDGAGGTGPWISASLALGAGTSPGGWLSMSMYAGGSANNTGPEMAYDNMSSAGYPGGLVTVASTVDDFTLPTMEGYRRFGDDYNLEGSNRSMSFFDVFYVVNIAVPTGSETMRFSIYDADTTAYTADFGNGPPAAAPTYQSAYTPLDTTAGQHTYTAAPTSDVTIPQSGYWFVEVGGIPDAATLSDEVAVYLHPVPTTGHSNVFFVSENFFGTWGGFWFGNPTPNVTGAYSTTYGNVIANFAARFRSAVYAHSAVLGPGATISNSVASTKAADDVRWNIRPGAVLVATADPVNATFTFYMPVASVGTMNVNVDSHATVTGIRQKVEINVPGGNTYTNLETFTGLPSGANPDRSVSLAVPTPNTYIDTALKNRVRVRCLAKNTTAVLVYPWQYQVDKISITWTP